MTQRERFEKWYASKNDGYVPNFTDGEYTQDNAQSHWEAWQAACPNDQYPMQPISNDQHCHPRFEANPIVEWLACEVTNLNRIAVWCADKGIDPKYQEQLAQLIGYSVDGYGSLSYVTDESYERAIVAAPQPEDKS